ncbi:MAG: CopG family transcriptional regulator [Mesorhizobium sp.]|nr:MAG: CopG family transcriptional regulator [Mesorhizobium sp.]
MRTTLAIDDDVLIAAKAMARQQDRSVGEIITDLARRSLRRPQAGGERNGIPLLSPRPDSPPVTLEMVNVLRDGLP